MVPSDIAMLATLDSVSYGSQRRLWRLIRLPTHLRSMRRFHS